ncbi:MAG: hypothetical protein ABH986_06090 [archaeon]
MAFELRIPEAHIIRISRKVIQTIKGKSKLSNATIINANWKKILREIRQELQNR